MPHSIDQDARIPGEIYVNAGVYELQKEESTRLVVISAAGVFLFLVVAAIFWYSVASNLTNDVQQLQIAQENANTILNAGPDDQIVQFAQAQLKSLTSKISTAQTQIAADAVTVDTNSDTVQGTVQTILQCDATNMILGSDQWQFRAPLQEEGGDAKDLVLQANGTSFLRASVNPQSTALMFTRPYSWITAYAVGATGCPEVVQYSPGADGGGGTGTNIAGVNAYINAKGTPTADAINQGQLRLNCNWQQSSSATYQVGSGSTISPLTASHFN